MIYNSIINPSPISTPENENEYVCLKPFTCASKAGRKFIAQRGDVVTVYQNEKTKQFVNVCIQLGWLANSNQITDGLRQYVLKNEYELKLFDLQHLELKKDFDEYPIPIWITLPKDNSKVGKEYLKLVENGNDLHPYRSKLYQKRELEYTPTKIETNLHPDYKEIYVYGEDLTDYKKELLQH